MASTPAFPKVISFDCASTLVKVSWTPEGFAADCMEAIGQAVTQSDADIYKSMFRSRLAEFVQANMTRDTAIGAAFWHNLGVDWLRNINREITLIDKIEEVADELAYGPSSRLFSLYPDVIPCLERLSSNSSRIIVISNWDYSLHRVLRMFGLHTFLELSIASLEWGVEKPDPRLFQIAFDQIGARPSEVVHVGDDPVDDVQGANAIGCTPILIDRSTQSSVFRSESGAVTISTLDQLEEALVWTD